MRSDCSQQIFPVPWKKKIYLEKYRFYKLEVQSFYGAGGGLQFLKFVGTRSGNSTNRGKLGIKHYLLKGTFVPKLVPAVGTGCDSSTKASQSYVYDAWNCVNALDGSWSSLFLSNREGVGMWMSFDIPR